VTSPTTHHMNKNKEQKMNALRRRLAYLRSAQKASATPAS
jgi:hypothetical protein